MATKNPTSPKDDQRTAITPDSIYDAASNVELSDMGSEEALKIKLCVANEEIRFKERIHKLEVNNTEFKVNYTNILRELREALQGIRFNDFLKILIGILGGFIINSITKDTEAFLKDKLGLTAFFLLVFCILFLIYQYIAPLKRKEEIAKELDRMNNSNE